jgi:hypothetical protein
MRQVKQGVLMNGSLHRLSVVLAGCIALAGFFPVTASGFTGPNGIICPTGTNPTTGLPWGPGDTYHLVFVTSLTTNAVSTSIAVYNTFVNDVADTSPLTGVPLVTWYAIGSTGTTDAKNNAVVSAPVYLLNGSSKIADGATDIWDGSITNPITMTQNGVTVAGNSIWTGSTLAGLKEASNRVLGSTGPRIGASAAINSTWIQNSNAGGKTPTILYPMYALSELLTIQSAGPETPVSPQPTNNAVEVMVSSSLSWASAGATGFTLELWPEGGETNLFSGAGMSWTPVGLQHATTYRWQVTGTNSSGSTVGPEWTFTTRAAVVPDAFLALTPTNNAVNVAAATSISWQLSNGTDGYEVYFWMTSAGEPASASATTTATIWDPPGDLAPDTSYSWKIVATNAFGATTNELRAFTTIPAVPGTPLPLAPTNNAVAEPVSISFTWSAALRASGYDVYLWADSESEPLAPNVTTASTTWYPGGLHYATTYHWKVAATNAYGTTAGGPWTFVTAAVPQPPPRRGLLPPTGTNPTTGLPWAPGDKYHLVFVTRGTTQATSSNIADYDRFVNTEAQRAGSLVAGYDVAWFVIGSTVATNAADHALVSAPVYRLDGVLVVTNKTDMWDSSLQAAIAKDQYNVAHTPSVWTGSTAAGLVNPTRALGVAEIRIGSAGQVNETWIELQDKKPPTEYRSIYALSEPLMIPLPQGTLIQFF